MIDPKVIYRHLLEVAIFCETIRTDHKCERCPLYRKGCLDEDVFVDVISNIKPDDINQMTSLADEITDEQESEDD